MCWIVVSQKVSESSCKGQPYTSQSQRALRHSADSLPWGMMEDWVCCAAPLVAAGHPAGEGMASAPPCLAHTVERADSLIKRQQPDDTHLIPTVAGGSTELRGSKSSVTGTTKRAELNGGHLFAFSKMTRRNTFIDGPPGPKSGAGRRKGVSNMEVRPCGECSPCCKLLSIDQREEGGRADFPFDKPAGNVVQAL